MGTERKSIIRHIRRMVLRDAKGLTDGQLLELFLVQNDEAAFEALVRRHGPMVLAVCRRVLKNQHDAEDAFQASFLVFIRRAASIAKPELLGNWLYGVAYRTAMKARVATSRRRAKEKQLAAIPQHEPSGEETLDDLLALLDQELNRLPDKYRAPVVLCDLQGLSRKEAAHKLGWPIGTLNWRLAKARTMLAQRLTRHGLALGGGTLAMALSGDAASAAVLSADDVERARNEKALQQILSQPGRFISLRQLFAYPDYPKDVTALRAEGYSVTRFLVESKGRKTFLQFIAEGMRDGWDKAVKQHYGFANVGTAEAVWLQRVEQQMVTDAKEAKPNDQPRTNPGISNPQTPGSEVDRKLALAFGEDCKEIRKAMVKISLPHLILATNQVNFEQDGRVRIAPSLVRSLRKRVG